MKHKIIAVDFDNTLFHTKYPYIYEPNIPLMNWLKKRQKRGDILILWTCRHDERLIEAIDYCGKCDLHFDYINENVPELIELYGETRKVNADIYIDDKVKSKKKWRLPFK